MKTILGILVLATIMLGGTYLVRERVISGVYPEKVAFNARIGVTPFSAAVKEYWVNQPTELQVRLNHIDGSEARITVSQSDDKFDWMPGETGPLPVSFEISEGRYATEWFPAHRNENFRVAIENMPSDPNAEKGTLVHVQVIRRPVIPDWIKMITPSVNEVYGLRLQAYDPTAEIDTESIMIRVEAMD